MSLTAPIAGRYQVLSELGRGGFGAVYLVEHLRTGEHLALKLLHGKAGADASMVERFRREARASAKIKSEHVVRVVDADVAPELGNAPFLVMELLNGCDLDQWVERQGKVPPAQVAKWLGEVAGALHKAHGLGIVHRDLKPENLFLHYREDGSQLVKILDFGIAKSLPGEDGTATSDVSLTKSGAVFGTPLYMAPEQALGRQDTVSPATDQWPLALIAYYLLTGEVFWTGDTFAALIVQIVAEPIQPPSQRHRLLPQGFDAWFLRSLERDPGRRFPSVLEQAAALSEVLGETAPTVAQSEPVLAAVPSYPLQSSSTEVKQTPPHELTVPLVQSDPQLFGTGAPLSSTMMTQPKRSRPPWLWGGALGGLLLLGVIAFGMKLAATPSVEEPSAASSAELPATNTPEARSDLPAPEGTPEVTPEEASEPAPSSSVPAPEPSVAAKAIKHGPAKRPGAAPSSAPKPTSTVPSSAPKTAPSVAPSPPPAKPATTKSTPYAPEAP